MRTIQQERQARDLELMMNIVNNDPGHIARAKAKREKVLRRQAEAKKPMAPETAILGAVSVVCIWCLSLVCLV